MIVPNQTITGDVGIYETQLPKFLQNAYNEWSDLFGHTVVDNAVVTHRRPLLYANVSSRDMAFCVWTKTEYPTGRTYQLKTPDEIAAQPVWEYV